MDCPKFIQIENKLINTDDILSIKLHPHQNYDECILYLEYKRSVVDKYHIKEIKHCNEIFSLISKALLIKCPIKLNDHLLKHSDIYK